MKTQATQERPVWQRVIIGLVITVVMIVGNSWWTSMEAQWLKGTPVESVLNWLSTAWVWFVCAVMFLALCWAALHKLLERLDKKR